MLLLVLALVELIGAQVLSVKANPYGFTFPTHTTAPDSVILTITVASPKENVVYTDSTINVCFNETITGPSSISKSIHIITTYQGDWMPNSRWCPFPTGVDIFKGQYDFLQHNFNLTDIPDGEHTLNITAQGQGGFNENNTEYSFVFQKTASVTFSVNTSPVHTTPVIAFQSPQNVTLTGASFLLDFTVNHSVSQMTYSLDAQAPIPISGNTTLTGLSNGQHNVTVYATDEFGNTGASDTLYFNVNAPQFPWVPLAAAIAAVSAVAVGAGLTVYHKKHRQPTIN